MNSITFTEQQLMQNPVASFSAIKAKLAMPLAMAAVKAKKTGETAELDFYQQLYGIASTAETYLIEELVKQAKN
jgi:hypothetical protein